MAVAAVEPRARALPSQRVRRQPSPSLTSAPSLSFLSSSLFLYPSRLLKQTPLHLILALANCRPPASGSSNAPPPQSFPLFPSLFPSKHSSTLAAFSSKLPLLPRSLTASASLSWPMPLELAVPLAVGSPGAASPAAASRCCCRLGSVEGMRGRE